MVWTLCRHFPSAISTCYNMYSTHMYTWAVSRLYPINSNLMITDISFIITAAVMLVPLNKRCCRKYLWAITSVYLWHMGLKFAMMFVIVRLLLCTPHFDSCEIKINIIIYTSVIKTYGITIKYKVIEYVWRWICYWLSYIFKLFYSSGITVISRANDTIIVLAFNGCIIASMVCADATLRFAI